MCSRLIFYLCLLLCAPTFSQIPPNIVAEVTCGQHFDHENDPDDTPPQITWYKITRIPCLPDSFRVWHEAYYIPDDLQFWAQTPTDFVNLLTVGFHPGLVSYLVVVPDDAINLFIRVDDNHNAYTIWDIWFTECVFDCCTSLPEELTIVPVLDTICPGDCITLTMSQDIPGYNIVWSTGDTTISTVVCPYTSTEYWAILSDTTCYRSFSYTVPVYQGSYDIPDTTICPGDSVTLFGTGYTVTWIDYDKSDTISVHPSSSETYWFAYIDTHGCEQRNDVQVTVEERYLPLTDINTCFGRPQLIVATGGDPNNPDTYTWSDGSHATSILVPPVTSDTALTLSITDTLGCVFSDTAYVFVNHCCPEVVRDYFYVPNALRSAPGDANNIHTIFPRPDIAGVSRILSYTVYDRWGELIRDCSRTSGYPVSDDPQYYWDGTYNGVVVNPGVYVCILTVMCENGTITHISTDITVF